MSELCFHVGAPHHTILHECCHLSDMSCHVLCKQWKNILQPPPFTVRDPENGGFWFVWWKGSHPFTPGWQTFSISCGKGRLGMLLFCASNKTVECLSACRYPIMVVRQNAFYMPSCVMSLFCCVQNAPFGRLWARRGSDMNGTVWNIKIYERNDKQNCWLPCTGINWNRPSSVRAECTIQVYDV